MASGAYRENEFFTEKQRIVSTMIRAAKGPLLRERSQNLGGDRALAFINLGAERLGVLGH